jgi:hypothetical protein
MSWWTSFRDGVESAAAVVGNVMLPGSGLVSSQLVSKGSQKQLGSTLGQLAMIGGGIYGAATGNLANYGKITGAMGLTGPGGTLTNAFGSSGAAGGTMNASQLNQAVSAYVDSGYSADQAMQFISEASGQPVSAINAVYEGTSPALQFAQQSPYMTSLSAAFGGDKNALSSVLGAGANVLGGYMQANAIKNASNAQLAAADKAVALQEAMYNQQRADIAPWRQAGEQGLGEYTKGVTNNGALVRPFSMADYQADPGYGFRMSEGMKALDRTAASRGGLLSGATLKGAQRFGQDLASQEYQNAYNRYTQNQQTQRNALANLAGIGQTASGQLQRAGEAYVGPASELQQGIGNVRASGYVQGANALSGGLTGAVSAYQNQQLLNSIIDRG